MYRTTRWSLGEIGEGSTDYATADYIIHIKLNKHRLKFPLNILVFSIGAELVRKSAEQIQSLCQAGVNMAMQGPTGYGGPKSTSMHCDIVLRQKETTFR